MSKQKLEDVAAFVLDTAKKAGATDCSVSISESTQFGANVRDGKVEGMEDNANFGVNVTAYVGQQTASESGHRRSARDLKELVTRVVGAAKISPADQFRGLPDVDQIVSLAAIPALDLWDAGLSRVSQATAIELAKRAEAASLSFDPRASISNGASYGQSKNRSVTGHSRGFLASTESGWAYVRAGVVSKVGDEKQTGDWASQKRFFAELQSPELIGQLAAQRAIEKLGGKRVKSQVVPMVVDRFMASRFLSYLAQAASGNALFTRQSFLLGKQGEQVAHPDISIVDDAHILRGLASRSFGEHGMPSGKRVIVQNGVLTNYFVDLYSSRRLNVAPNGGIPSNLCILAGKTSPDEIIASVDNGLYLQNISGHGFNATNGNISFSASGYWIENGKKAFPVQGITIAGNLLDLFLSVEAVGDDLIWDRSVTAPTLKFKAIAVAGE